MLIGAIALRRREGRERAQRRDRAARPGSERKNVTRQNLWAQSPSPACGRGAGERALLRHAKSMRACQTEAEQGLWRHLRAQRLMGLKFKRQKPVGPFIVDFVCLELGWVVEADGGRHGGQRDRRRDDWLKRQGFTVLHFWDNEVLSQTEAVLERIWREALALGAASLPPDPSPASGIGEKEGAEARLGARPGNEGEKNMRRQEPAAQIPPSGKGTVGACFLPWQRESGNRRRF